MADTDKVSVNLGAGGFGPMGGGYGNDKSDAALVAAILGRNRGCDDDRGRGRDGELWPALIAMLSRRGGCDDDCGARDHDSILFNMLQQGIGDIKAEVPLAALETQNAIQGAVSALALGTQQGFANNKDALQTALLATLGAVAGTKDAVQTAFTILNQNILDQGCKGRETTQAGTTAVLQKLDQNEIDRLRHERDSALRTVEVNALRSQVEVNQTVTTTQAQAQAQGQVQIGFNDLLRRFDALCSQVQRVSQGQDVINFGTMAASGNQQQTTSQVR